MNVTGIGQWQRRFGYLGSALCCQVTRIELDGHTGYVRENLRHISGLTTSSSHRLGITGGIVRGKVRPGSIPKHAVEILELTAPDVIWQPMAAAVARLDTRRRPVVRSNRWCLHHALTLHYENPKAT